MAFNGLSVENSLQRWGKQGATHLGNMFPQNGGPLGVAVGACAPGDGTQVLLCPGNNISWEELVHILEIQNLQFMAGE